MCIFPHSHAFKCTNAMVDLSNFDDSSPHIHICTLAHSHRQTERERQRDWHILIALSHGMNAFGLEKRSDCTTRNCKVDTRPRSFILVDFLLCFSLFHFGIAERLHWLRPFGHWPDNVFDCGQFQSWFFMYYILNSSNMKNAFQINVSSSCRVQLLELIKHYTYVFEDPHSWRLALSSFILCDNGLIFIASNEDIQIVTIRFYFIQPFELSHCYVLSIRFFCCLLFVCLFDTIHLHRFSIIPLLNMYLKFTWQRFA